MSEINDKREESQTGELQRVVEDRRVARLLVERGVIEEAQFGQAQKQYEQQGGSIVDNLLLLGHVETTQLVTFLIENGPEVGVDAGHLDLSLELTEIIPADLARKYNVLPVDRLENVLTLASAEPLSAEARKELEDATALTVKAVLCAPEDIGSALIIHYGEADSVEAEERLEVGVKFSRIVHLIRQVASLPALPETVTQVKEIMEKPSSTVHDVVGVLTLDPAIAAKVLSVSNSAAYGFPNQINDLTLAVSLLGLRETYGIVLSVAVADLANKMRHFDYKTYWLDSMCSAAAARIVAKACGKRRLPGVFSAALLHDIGRVVLVELQPRYGQLLPAGLTGAKLDEEERKHIGLSHTEAGYELARYWNLPEEIAEPIRFHHRPQHAVQARTYVAIVALANIMATTPAENLQEAGDLFAGYEAALDILGLDDELTEAMVDEFLELRNIDLEQPA